MVFFNRLKKEKNVCLLPFFFPQTVCAFSRKNKKKRLIFSPTSLTTTTSSITFDAELFFFLNFKN